MKHKWTAAAAAALLAGTAGGAWGQEMGGGGGFRAGRFDLGIYAGGSVTSDWFSARTITLDGTETGADNGDAQGFLPGYAPVFGATATLWLSPAFGVRAHGSYTPMRLPYTGGAFGNGATDRQRYVLNTYFYDLDLVLRPFAMREGAGMWRSVYLFAGGGGMTVNVAGTNRRACQASLLALGACLPLEPRLATVGQGTGGVGMDLLRFGRSLALFGELAAHVYDSPVHVGDEWVGPVTAIRGSVVPIADDRTTVTGRLVLGLKLQLGDLLPALVPPPPPPIASLGPGTIPPPQPPSPPPAPPEAPAAACAVNVGMAAGGETWFVNSEPVTFNGRRYVKYGLPRVLGASDVASVGSYRGVSVFAEPSADRMRPEVIYLPTSPRCEFQAYQVEVKAGAVRG
ncbi:hypothetical protein [Longimicrobium sp.]|uniref:hypothetical protein n=1 Tax=Longimicrobium sp. TaxID=2029185 RepID=UPI002B8E942A|nr:hypothetical protein [Longimicrobium sp.]HSU16918.1 hypothetical protein [Longimicrobium sp.]